MDLYEMIDAYIYETLDWVTDAGKHVLVQELHDKHIDNILSLDHEYDNRDAWELILKIEKIRRNGCSVAECREKDFVLEDTKTYETPPAINNAYSYDSGMGNSKTITAYYQTCPKCNGQGIVSVPPYVAGDVLTFTSSGTETYTCPVCGGQGVLLVKEENNV